MGLLRNRTQKVLLNKQKLLQGNEVRESISTSQIKKLIGGAKDRIKGSKKRWWRVLRPIYLAKRGFS